VKEKLLCDKRLRFSMIPAADLARRREARSEKRKSFSGLSTGPRLRGRILVDRVSGFV
jgi:hypothetical protein